MVTPGAVFGPELLGKKLLLDGLYATEITCDPSPRDAESIVTNACPPDRGKLAVPTVWLVDVSVKVTVPIGTTVDVTVAFRVIVTVGL